MRLRRRFGGKWEWDTTDKTWWCSDGKHYVVSYVESSVRMLELRRDNVVIARFKQDAIKTEKAAKQANLPVLV